MRILLILSFLPFLALTVTAGEYEPEESIVPDHAPPQPEEESIEKASADWKPREGSEDVFNNEHLDGAGFFLPYKDLDLERNIFGEGAKSPLKESPYDTAPAIQPPRTSKYSKEEPAKETPSSYAKETPAPYAKETPSPYATEQPAPYEKQTEAPYATEQPAPYEKETKAPYAKEKPAPYEKETKAPYATEPPAPYVKETKAPYATEQHASYEKETEAPYATEPPAPYEKETEAPYATEQPASYEKETKAPYATEQPASYEKEVKAPYAPEQPESYAKETTAYATEQPKETTYAAKDSHDGPKKPKTDNEAISQEIERIDKTIADIDSAIKSTAEHNPLRTQAGSYGVEDFQNEESLYKNHPAQPVETRRMFDHTLEVPMLKIASLGRFKQFIKMFKVGGQATDKEGVCDRKPNCDPKSKYRTFDGTCNNLKVTNHGAVNAPYRRLLPPAYGDGNYLPRGVSEFSKEHGYVSSLPSPRKISDTVMEQGNETLTESSVATHMVMQWGQFIDHDMMSTSKEAFDCCDPEIRNTFRCFPIDIPAEDSFYSQFGKQCLDFTRSDIHCKSSLKYAEQFNTQSSFLDASHIYGSSKEAADMLRGGKNRKGGRLLGNSVLPHFLPSKFDLKMKSKEHDLGTDFVAGDMRVETQSSLTAVHNLFFNEHNRIADGLYQELKKRYSMPDTDLDELVFQETRRLVIAEIQEVTYREFLPVVLGKQAMIENKLEQTAECIYNPETDPCIINAFGAAAFRFGHSLIQSIFRGENQPWRLGKFFADSRFARSEGGTAYVNELKGLSKQPCQRADLHISQQMTQNLFCNNQTAPGGGHDIASYNIQRGRDHGIPGYAKFRELCGLSPIKSLKETPEGVDPASWSKIQSVYGSVDEIDLFVGGLAEIPAKDGLIGPTFGCIIGKQFKALMEGDRFFSHHVGGPDIFPLKGAAAAGLGSRTLAAIICEVTGADKLPPNVFQLIDEAGMKACSELPKLDLMKIASEIEIN